MPRRLHSSGIAALSFTLSAFALTPAIASTATASDVTITGDRTLSSKRVSAADLDLTRAGDRKRLDTRVRNAIALVCIDGATPLMTPAESRCRAEAQRSSGQQIAALRGEALAAAGAERPASVIAVVAAR